MKAPARKHLNGEFSRPASGVTIAAIHEPAFRKRQRVDRVRPASPRLCAAWVALTLIGLSQTSFAQGDPLLYLLANARSLSCAFSKKATGTWKDGLTNVEGAPAKL